MALDLVSGADLLCKLMCEAGPVDPRGSRGPRGRPDPQNRRSPVGQKGAHIKAKQLLGPGAAAPHALRRGSAGAIFHRHLLRSLSLRGKSGEASTLLFRWFRRGRWAPAPGPPVPRSAISLLPTYGRPRGVFFQNSGIRASLRFTCGSSRAGLLPPRPPMLSLGSIGRPMHPPWSGRLRRLPEKGGLAEGGFGFGCKSVVSGVWAAPGGFKTIQKGWGASLSTFSDGFEVPRHRPDPENDRFSAKSQTPLC